MAEKGKAKPDCYYRAGVEIGACAVCKWFKECPMQGHAKKVKATEKSDFLSRWEPIIKKQGEEMVAQNRAKKGKARATIIHAGLPECPECGEKDDVAVLCFEGEPTRFACNNCEHEWEEADKDVH